MNTDIKRWLIRVIRHKLVTNINGAWDLNSHRLPRRVAKYLFCGVLSVTALHLIFTSFGPHLDVNRDLLKMVDLDKEANLPTLYTASLWVFCIILTATITCVRKRTQYPFVYWLVMALIMVYMLVDELFMLHEEVRRYFDGLESVSPFLYRGWVIPYSILVVGVSLFFVRFVIGLPSNTRFLFLLGGCIFVMGALCTEAIAGYYVLMYGKTGFYRLLLVPIEEVLEMTGLVIFIYGLLSYIEMELNGLPLVPKQAINDANEVSP